MKRYKSIKCSMWGLLGCILTLLSSNTLVAKTVNVDSLFMEARYQAFEMDDRVLARDLCQEALQISPEYHDIRIFLGRLYAWDKMYNKAEKELAYVLSKKPKYDDARSALLDVYLWSEQYEEALRTAKAGLRYAPVNEIFLYSKAFAEMTLQENEAAATTLDKLLQINPSHERGNDLLEQLVEKGRQYKASLNYTYDHFQNADTRWAFFCTGQDRNPWHSVSTDISRRMSFGSLISRVNHARRFDDTGYQIEVDAYPKVRPGTYLYLNLGYSWTSLFPEFRLGGEVFQSLPAAFEISLGFRSMFFEASDVTVFTASLGKYAGSYWLNLRTFFTPKDVSFSRTIIFTARRYFGDADNYLTFSASLGQSPDELIGQTEVDYLGARKFGLGGQWKLNTLTFLKWGVGFSNEEWSTGSYLKNCSLNVGMSRRF